MGVAQTTELLPMQAMVTVVFQLLPMPTRRVYALLWALHKLLSIMVQFTLSERITMIFKSFTCSHVVFIGTGS